MAFLFKDVPDCEVLASAFPVGTAKQFGPAALPVFLRTVWEIRRRRPSITLDLTGDVRERWFARLLAGRSHVHIGWAKGHPYRRLIRNPLGAGRPLVTVPADVPSVYAAYELMLEALAPSSASTRAREASLAACGGHKERDGGGGLRIGMHPFASQPSKLWPAPHWRQLAVQIAGRGAHVTAYAAPAERRELEALFAGLGEVELVTVEIEEFAERLRTLDLLVGVDSFAVHMAYRQGIRSVTINAGTPPQLWAPPRGRGLGGAGGCKHYPCYNVAPCRGTAGEYACVRSVSPADVLSAIDAMGIGHHG
jgi:heptosyltransferase III